MLRTKEQIQQDLAKCGKFMTAKKRLYMEAILIVENFNEKDIKRMIKDNKKILRLYKTRRKIVFDTTMLESGYNYAMSQSQNLYTEEIKTVTKYLNGLKYLIMPDVCICEIKTSKQCLNNCDKLQTKRL